MNCDRCEYQLACRDGRVTLTTEGHGTVEIPCPYQEEGSNDAD